VCASASAITVYTGLMVVICQPPPHRCRRRSVMSIKKQTLSAVANRYFIKTIYKRNNIQYLHVLFVRPVCTDRRHSRVDSHGGSYTAIGVYYTHIHKRTNANTYIL